MLVRLFVVATASILIESDETPLLIRKLQSVYIRSMLLYSFDCLIMRVAEELLPSRNLFCGFSTFILDYFTSEAFQDLYDLQIVHDISRLQIEIFLRNRINGSSKGRVGYNDQDKCVSRKVERCQRNVEY